MDDEGLRGVRAARDMVAGQVAVKIPKVLGVVLDEWNLTSEVRMLLHMLPSCTQLCLRRLASGPVQQRASASPCAYMQLPCRCFRGCQWSQCQRSRPLVEAEGRMSGAWDLGCCL